MLLGLAVCGSGVAALINQVVWQRGLKIFLGGSETLASTIVVLVFMLGLGGGSVWAGRRAGGLANPLRALAAVEALLFAVNLGVAAVLASDLRDSVVSVRIAADAAGVPVELAYAVVSFAVLAAPCALMGMTAPLSAEGFQRQVGRAAGPRMLAWLLVANTLGSVFGALWGSGWMLPVLGQMRTLGVASLGNLGCAAIAAGLSLAPATPPSPERPAEPAGLHRVELALSAVLGALALGYELALFRMVALAHLPLPYVFAAALAGFLAYWSLGAGLAGRFEAPLGRVLRLTALAVAVAYLWMLAGPHPADLDGVSDAIVFGLGHAPLFAPCVGFGYAFSRLASRCRASWGTGVGALYAWNTVGAAIGIVGVTFVGLALPLVVLLLLLAAGVVAASELDDGAPRRAGGMLAAVCAAAVLGLFAPWNASEAVRRGLYGHPGYVFQGHAGVIEVRPDGNLVWDGLWHSALSRDGDHVGTNNWFLAVAPIVAHGAAPIDEALVIGLGTGITAETLARAPEVGHVTVYDINRTIGQVLARFPDGTLGVADDPKVDLRWMDGRAALALGDATFDLVQTQPMWLKQAGSTLLDSIAFHRLVASRLRPGGVFCLYANGSAEQAYLVRQTAGEVFPYRASLFDGYLLILSNDPIDLSEAALARIWDRPGAAWDEIRAYPATATPERFLRWVDDPAVVAWAAPGETGPPPILATDDRPILEYPHLLRAAYLRAGRDPAGWPTPQPPWAVTQAWIAAQPR